MIEISEGRRNVYLIPGILLFIFGVIVSIVAMSSSIIILIPGTVLIIFSILLFAATSGLQLDYELNRYREYKKVGNQYIGSWQTLGNIQSAVLISSIENMREGRPFMAAQSRGSSMSTVVSSFDIQLIDSNAEETTIYEFLEYKHARKTLSEIHNKMEIPARDKVAERMAENKKSRR